MSNNLLPRRLTWKQWAAAAVAVVALAAVAWVIFYETDRDRLEDLMDSTLAALEEGDAQAAVEGVSPEFESYGLSRAELRRLIENGLQRYGRPELSILKEEFRIAEQYASCRFTLLAWGPEGGRRPVRTEWTVSFQKTDNRWRIIGIESRSGLGEYFRRVETLADQFGIELVPEN
ncbi:MAG: hypothetical protein V5A84_02105 [Planctomycetota bacterium]